MDNKAMQKNQYSPGKHVLLDFWGVERVNDLEFIEKALKEAALVCGAKVLDVKLHSFGEGCGVTGVLVLAESHISIHTWPEIDFCAIDVFMCGDCDAENAVEPLKKAFGPSKFNVRILNRGEEVE